MTYQLTVLYGRPDDPAAFDAHYEGTHVPLALQMPGVESYTGFHPADGPDGTPAETYFVAQLTFADAEAFAAATGGEAGRAAIGDVKNFATGGATLLTGEVRTFH